MNKSILILALALSFNSISQEVVSTQGDSYTKTNGSIDFTIGEVIANTASSNENTLTQGFHQTNWMFLSVENHQIDYEATVYPNPMSSVLNIQSSAHENVSYTVNDARGRIVSKGNLQTIVTEVDVSLFAPGSYSLVLFDEKHLKLKTFKLIKRQ